MSKICKLLDQAFTGRGLASKTGSNGSGPGGKINDSESSGSSSDESGYASKPWSEADESVSVPKGKMKSPDKKVASGSNANTR